jgi:hypothetical protein
MKGMDKIEEENFKDEIKNGRNEKMAIKKETKA